MAKPLGALRKRDRQALRRRERNRACKSRLRSALRDARAALSAGDAEAAVKVASACRLAQKIASKGVIHRNKAARLARRLHRRLGAVEAPIPGS